MVKDLIKEIVITDDDKPGKRKALDAGAAQKEEVAIGWDFESTPLNAVGGKKPKFLAPSDKHNVNEGETVFVTFKVEGDPAPTAEWFKVPEKDMSCNPRGRVYTNGAENTITMGLRNCKAEDEGDFQCILTNSNGTAKFDFKLFVTVEGGMDFRAMLMKKKTKQKKIVVERTEWIEPLFDIEAQEKKDKQVVLQAKLSVKNMKGKWYQRNEKIMADIKSGENGRELMKSDKYDWKQEEDVYTLYINNPTTEEDGTYILLVREVDAKTSCYVTVKRRDPEYWFVKPLQEKQLGYTNRPFSLAVEISEPGVNLKWLKNGAIINWAEQTNIIKKDEGCYSCIHFPNVTMDDSSYYSAQIMEFMKNGEDDQTNCWFEVEEYPHTFTSKLVDKNVVEKDTVEFEITTEADDAEVKWYKDNKVIVPDGDRITIVEQGKVRKLILKNCQVKDSGDITCKTNKDKSSAKLRVGVLNEITSDITSDGFRSVKGMVFAVEREDAMFYVSVKDPNAPVEFYINGVKINKSESRYRYTEDRKGKHQLYIRRLELSDAGTIEARTPLNKGDKMLTTETALDIMMGERKPEFKRIGKGKKGSRAKAEGVAGKSCGFEIDYQVEGKKQSELDFKILSPEGKELKKGQDVNITMADGVVKVDFLNPKHDKSGAYKVVMSNAQGSAEEDIDVNIMDKPGSPDSCTVNQVFKDNCMVNWKPPSDNGGSEILGYIIEEQNVESGGNWSTVAEAGASDTKAKITGLKPGGKYRYRVKAINKLGQSLPCDMNGNEIIAKDPWTEPGPPGKPNILDWGKTHADLSWKVPEKDGGAKITHYVLEAKENNMKDFIAYKTYTIAEVMEKGGVIQAKCDGLTEGYEYTFRVKAVNLASDKSMNYSLPSPPSESLMIKTRYISAKVKEPGLHDLEVKAGKTICYDVWFSGEPAPTAAWIKDDVVLEKDERITIESMSKSGTYTEINSTLTIIKANRKEDTGNYKIRLTCGGGNAEATAFVNVIDVPTKPTNLVVSDVRAENCKLTWSPPEDDGGTPLTGYSVQILDLESNVWMPCAETKSPELSVAGLKPGHLYKFEVTALNKEGVSPPIRTLDPVKAENPYVAPSAPTDLNIVDFDEESVTLRWAKPQNTGGRAITNYIIQKKDEFGGWFDALVTDNDNCFATIEQLESRVPGLSLGKKYCFRVLAVSKAGESSPSKETKPHLCRYKNLAPSIEKGSGRSVIVKKNRQVSLLVKIKGEPLPSLSWKKDGAAIPNIDEAFTYVHNEEDQSVLARLSIPRAQLADSGTYSLLAENRKRINLIFGANGIDSVDIDLIVLDEMHANDCEMFSSASLQCTCNCRYRAEIADEKTLQASELENSNPKMVYPKQAKLQAISDQLNYHTNSLSINAQRNINIDNIDALFKRTAR